MKTETTTKTTTTTAQGAWSERRAAGGLKVRTGVKAGGTYNWGRI